MPYFTVSDSNKLVVTNFKVMFSSFKKTNKFNKIKRYKAKLIIKYADPQVYFTVRDPYQKAISFYKDKFQKIPQNAEFSKSFKWEKPQRVFFPLMGLSVKCNSNEEIQQALLNTSFDDFVGLLANCYWLDEHIHPQHWILNHPNYLMLTDLGIKAERLSVYKMDRASEMEAFANATGFDFSKRANSTGKIMAPQTISPRCLEIINRIYQQDFEHYGYEMRQA
jgi:hypothetical protein